MCATMYFAEVREPEVRVSWLLLTLWVQGIKLKVSDLAAGALLTMPLFEWRNKNQEMSHKHLFLATVLEGIKGFV